MSKLFLDRENFSGTIRFMAFIKVNNKTTLKKARINIDLSQDALNKIKRKLVEQGFLQQEIYKNRCLIELTTLGENYLTERGIML